MITAYATRCPCNCPIYTELRYKAEQAAEIMRDRVLAGEVKTQGQVLNLKHAIKKLPSDLREWVLGEIAEILQGGL